MRFLCLTLMIGLLLFEPARAETIASHSGHDGMQMDGMLGPYPMSREASGTSWQPEAAPMTGLHHMAGEWMFMLHGYADLVYTDQGGPRGNDKIFVPSMLMLMGQRSWGPGTLGARAMLSLDPLMGRSGYPLLFQTGETADGVNSLVDRQHPHDLFMELAGTYSIPVGAGSVFSYLGLPGEPALGPPAFMHRASGVVIPEAPLTHHWLDSTHITFGVVTLGVTLANWKMEVSAFNGREPDQFRWNIETRRFDSYSGRVSFNPGTNWSAQLSYGYLASPEQLEPEVLVHRTTASVSYTKATGSAHWSTTLATGINRQHGEDRPGYLLESTRQFTGPLAVFGRAEYLRNEHLFESGPLAGREFGIGKITLGGARNIGSWGALGFDAGALVSAYSVPGPARAEYGSAPVSYTIFLRTRIQ